MKRIVAFLALMTWALSAQAVTLNVLVAFTPAALAQVNTSWAQEAQHGVDLITGVLARSGLSAHNAQLVGVSTVTQNYSVDGAGLSAMLREQLQLLDDHDTTGADFILVYAGNEGACGAAGLWPNDGLSLRGALVAINCIDSTTAHEAAHLFGSNHAYPSETALMTPFPYGHGYKTCGTYPYGTGTVVAGFRSVETSIAFANGNCSPANQGIILQYYSNPGLTWSAGANTMPMGKHGPPDYADSVSVFVSTLPTVATWRSQRYNVATPARMFPIIQYLSGS